MEIKEILPGAKENISLAEHSSFEIGGPARYFFVVRKKENLIKALEFCRNTNTPYLIMGEGTNILFPDEGFAGLVVKIETNVVTAENKKIYSGAGAKLFSVFKLSLENSLRGLEWAVGIPGTLGGAVYGNAQAFGQKMSDTVETVEVLDSEDLKFYNLSNKECFFENKNSIFKKNKNLIIVSATLSLKEGNVSESRKEVKRHVEYRKQKHPLYFPSAGSVFVNHQGKIKGKKLLQEFPELEEFNKKEIIPSAYLIEKCGLKGKIVGGAKFSDQHANFIVNLGAAKAEDVIELVNLAKNRVKNKFNIDLKEEIQIIK